MSEGWPRAFVAMGLGLLAGTAFYHAMLWVGMPTVEHHDPKEIADLLALARFLTVTTTVGAAGAFYNSRLLDSWEDDDE